MKVALVTGASRGIGLGLCRELHARGWRVIATCRCPETIAGEPFWMKAALAVDDDRSIAALAQTLAGQPVDLLINNAGISMWEQDSLDALGRETMQRLFNVNSISPLLVSRALLPNIVASEAGGVIVNISSLMGSIGDCGSARSYGYRSSKAALDMITKTMSLEERLSRGVVVAIHPGFVSTDMTRHAGGISVQEASTCIVSTIEGLQRDRHNGCLLSRLGKIDPW